MILLHKITLHASGCSLDLANDNADVLKRDIVVFVQDMTSSRIFYISSFSSRIIWKKIK